MKRIAHHTAAATALAGDVATALTVFDNS